MTSAQIRQSFLDFFASKAHTLVPSASLMPDSPNLLFTNAGMNQFVPIFLGERAADVSRWAGARPASDTRAADTQKCIRAGGKHNDLDDVGLDTYHHTFFEMLGNWSFGDYFKKEAIDWAWELVVERWKFPPGRLYATIYQPDAAAGDPAERDEEAWGYWAEKFRAAGLDPAVHIVNGNKKDNFWMMGDTGPCGPCSELHVDLTQDGDTRGALVNKGSSECIEIWNLVFIQFNANPDGTFTPLPARHVDTGMGFERVTSILQCTRGFTHFGGTISNYETDIFRPIFDELERMSGRRYGSTLPNAGTTGTTEQQRIDVAFRVIADHIRTLSFAIADGIEPGNSDRNYVLRRILRRAVRYGRTLGFDQPFFYKLVDVLAATMGDIFPEIRSRKAQVQAVLQREEESFNRTLDKGIALFKAQVTAEDNTRLRARELEDSIRRFRERIKKLPDSKPADSSRLARLKSDAIALFSLDNDNLASADDSSALNRLSLEDRFRIHPLATLLEIVVPLYSRITKADKSEADYRKLIDECDQVCTDIQANLVRRANRPHHISDRAAFDLYDTYGFPLDLTELMARERGMTVDTAGFNRLMEAQRARARAAQKKQIIELSQVETQTPTRFAGYDLLATEASVVEVVTLKDRTAVILDASTCYAEMGGQVGDTGELAGSGQLWRVVNTQKSGHTWLHFIEGEDAPAAGQPVQLRVDRDRRRAIERHHTVTHLLHWALHAVVSHGATQKGSFVGPDKLTFDFNHAALTPSQLADIERLVNERILENAGVSWTEVPHAEVKDRADVLQFFGDKYGDVVRVVQIGGQARALDGYSMELCGGTHTRSTGEIGLFRIVAESAIAAGVRRIEAVAGLAAHDLVRLEHARLQQAATRLNTPVAELDKKLDALLAHQKELEKALRTAVARNASNAASELLGRAVEVNGIPLIAHNLGAADGDYLQAVVDALKGRFPGVIVLGGGSEDAVALVAAVGPEFTGRAPAGKLIQQIAPIVGGRGGGRPDNARGGGKDAAQLDAALAKVRELLA